MYGALFGVRPFDSIKMHGMYVKTNGDVTELNVKIRCGHFFMSRARVIYTGMAVLCPLYRACACVGC
jgi:hypothetical protein